jgi:hypothetical protein
VLLHPSPAEPGQDDRRRQAPDHPASRGRGDTIVIVTQTDGDDHFLFS